MNTTPRRRLDLATWLPDASTLPGTALLLVASRAGADVHLPLAHPLCDDVQRITASEAATEIRHAAHAELEQALKVSVANSSSPWSAVWRSPEAG